MRQVLLDTNVLASFLTDRDRAQQEQATELLQQAAGGELELILHQLVLAELVYVLLNLYSQPATEVAAIVHDLLALPGVRCEDSLSWPTVLAMWPVAYPHFADAALASVCKLNHVDAIATFDDGFRRRLVRHGLVSHW